jgi:hypothetical protein
MWLACALIVLFSVGFVLPCMLDITTTPDTEFMTFGKGTWLLIVGAFWIFGAAAWLIVGRPQRPMLRRRSYPRGALGQTEAFFRHPAAQGAAGYGEPFTSLASMAARGPVGPDDDPDFLLELERRIRELREGS